MSELSAADFCPDICAKSESNPKCLRKSLHKKCVFDTKCDSRQNASDWDTTHATTKERNHHISLFCDKYVCSIEACALWGYPIREVFKKLRREKLHPKNTTGVGGGGQRCQKDTTVPTISDFNAISTKNSRLSTILWQKRTQRGGVGGVRGRCVFWTQFFPS